MENKSQIPKKPEFIGQATEKERIPLSFEKIKEIIRTEIGERADIKTLEIKKAPEGAKFVIRVSVGMGIGEIAVEGFAINIPMGIAVEDLAIKTNAALKLLVEKKFEDFDEIVKRYFEKLYGKPVSSMQLVGTKLVVDFE